MSEVGIVGQIYEDRRTKKRGKLVERDEKYKTLLMESDDGKSFNITYGGFKSNWRKVDEEIPTVEEALQEVEVPAEIIKNDEDKIVNNVKPVKTEKKTRDQKNVSTEHKSISDFEEVFNKFVTSFNSEKVSVQIAKNRKGNKSDFAIIMLGMNRFVEFYLRARGYFWLIMPEFVYARKWSVKLFDQVSKIKNKMSCKVSWEELEQFLEDLRPVVVDILSAKVEEDK